VGVLSDFHQRSLRYEMKPAVFVLDKNGTNFSIKISGVGSSEERRTILAQIENSYRKFFPDDPFEYFFLEDRFNEQYQDDRRFSTLFSVFSVLALFIAWLGLAGLIAFFLLYRQKEIGIRKVLGATVASILEMVTKSYVKLGLICLVIVIPITHYFITQWLERYAYHITPDWWMFGIPGVVVLLATIVVIVGQAMKSALTNPAESLRNE
jgi:putative ABC transport system permease protein